MRSIHAVIPILLSDVTPNLRCGTRISILTLGAICDAGGPTQQLANALLRIASNDQRKATLVATIQKNCVSSGQDGHNNQENPYPANTPKAKKNEASQEGYDNRYDTRHAHAPNDASSATRPTERVDCNHDPHARFAAG